MKQKIRNIAEIADKLKKEVMKVNKNQAMIWAIECAQRVIHHFEKFNPNDSRPRNALEIARRWLKGEVIFKEIRRSSLNAHAAARDSKNFAAIYAARSCAHAVATAHVITHAARAALYALKVIEVVNPDLVDDELSWQLEYLKRIKEGKLNEL